MKNAIKLAAFAFFLAWFASCESSTYEEISTESDNEVITYQKNVKSIINNNCIECHANNNQYPNMETYEQVKAAVYTGNVLCRIDDQSCGSVMPPTGRLQSTQINIIKRWAENGYQN